MKVYQEKQGIVNTGIEITVFFARGFSSKLQIVFPHSCMSNFPNVAGSVAPPTLAGKQMDCRHVPAKLIKRDVDQFAAQGVS